MQQPYIISAQQRAIVLNPAQPEMLCNLLPMAREFEWNGHNLYAVPHDVDVVRLLRNVGVTVPSPIQYQYTWPGRHPPFMAQRATADFLTLHPRAFVLNDMGTGKTRAALYAYDYLRSIGQRRRMLVVGPLSTLERTWADEIFYNFPHLTFGVLHGTKDRRLKLLKHPFDVYIVNHDGLEIIAGEVAKRDDIDVILVDELAVYRNSGTDRYKAVEKICTPIERAVWGMTGTPIPNEPTDAWAQVKLILPSRVPKYFGRFRDQVMTKFGPYKWVPKSTAIRQVQEVMQPAIRFSRDDCLDLPETTYQTRQVPLTKEQQKVYDELARRMKSEAEEGTVRAVNEADKLMKLVQVAAGAVYTTEGETVSLENGPRIREVLDIIEQSPGKVIVFVPFIAALHNMRDAIAKHYPCEMVYGGTSKTDRDQAFWRIQNLPKEESRVLVANAAAMSHGLTLTEASTIVWIAPTTSHDTFDQANHRIIRAGQKNKTLIVMLEGTPVERKIYTRLQQRQAMQGLLLDAVREAVPSD
jgi:SNF2 family DNA or RNA helicase